MKKILSVLLLACMLVGMLAMAGCQPAANNGANANFVVPEGGYDGSEVTITFSHTMGAKLQEVLNYHIGEFNKVYPNIKVEHSSAGLTLPARSTPRLPVTISPTSLTATPTMWLCTTSPRQLSLWTT